MSFRIKILLIFGLILALASFVTFLYFDRAQGQASEEALLARTRAFFQQIVITRRWVAYHGGVYVRKGSGIETNPYLLEIPGLTVDIQDTDGKNYTLRNPALVTRELSALAEKQGIYKFHITSLILVNPDNSPDDFETQALQEFEIGQAEAWRYEENGDQQIFRYMAPLFIEESCLPCHASLGYVVGDVRGGISVSVPVTRDVPVRIPLLLGWLLGSTITLAALYWSLNAIILQPILKLKAAADTISHGKYNQPVSVTATDEIGDLASSFERMRAKVQVYIQSLEVTVQERTLELRKHADQLEDLVTIRTQELRQTQERMHRHERLAVLGHLAGGVSHELRNPLGVISNAVYYLNMVLPDEDNQLREYLELIQTNTNQATSIVGDLLDFARIKSVERFPANLSDLVAVVLYQHPPPDNVTLNVEIPEDLPHVFVDPRQISQVFVNLVTNAYQAMPGGGELTIEKCESFTDNSDAQMIALCIRDTGSGIHPENMDKIFEPLFTTKARGIGLGLAFSKMLVEANEGDIDVDSSLGKGSTFTIYLPVNQKED